MHDVKYVTVTVTCASVLCDVQHVTCDLRMTRSLPRTIASAVHFFDHFVRLNLLEILLERANLNFVPLLLHPAQQVEHELLLAIQQRTHHWQRGEEHDALWQRMRTAERALRGAQPPDLLQGVVVVGARARVWLDRQRDYALMADNDLTCDV